MLYQPSEKKVASTSKKLAINGGTPIRTKLFPAYNTIGEEEKQAVMKVLDSGTAGSNSTPVYTMPSAKQVIG